MQGFKLQNENPNSSSQIGDKKELCAKEESMQENAEIIWNSKEKQDSANALLENLQNFNEENRKAEKNEKIAGISYFQQEKAREIQTAKQIP